jgi:VanZ family protein
MTGLILWSLVFVILLIATLSVALSQAQHKWLTSNSTVLAVSFLLTATLGFILTDDLLKLPNPIALTVILVLLGAVLLELSQYLIVRQKAALRDVILVLCGACLCLLTRFVMHETGRHIIDTCETFMD